MIRSMFSAVSGLLNHQNKMDVIGNNIANVSTVGFKVSEATISEAAIQLERSASADQPLGLAVGLGSRLVGTKTSFSQGAFQRTDVPSDLALNGDGFFNVGTTTAGGSVFVTRSGNFVVDNNGYFRTVDGDYLLGEMGTGTTANVTAAVAAAAAGTPGTFPSAAVFVPAQIGGVDVGNYTVGLDGTITAVDTAGTSMDVGRILLSSFSNNNGLRREGNGLWSNAAAAGHQGADPANSAFLDTAIQSAALEMANVDLAKQFSDMIITQRSFDANARTISTSDEMLQTVVNLKR